MLTAETDTIILWPTATQLIRVATLTFGFAGEHDYSLCVTRDADLTHYDIDLTGVHGEALDFAVRNQSNDEIYETTIGPVKRKCKCSCTGFQCRKACVHVDALHAHFAAGNIEHPAAAM